MRTTPTLIEALPERLSEHQAVKAWAALNPERVEPESIEVLKFKRLESKSAVYRLNGVAPDGSAVVAKRCLAVTASVERIIYEELLSQLPLPAVRYYGHVDEPGGEFGWLFLENAGGLRYSPSDAGHRSIAARWLASIQAAAVGAGLETRLPPRDADYYLGLLRSTRDRFGEHFPIPNCSPPTSRRCAVSRRSSTPSKRTGPSCTTRATGCHLRSCTATSWPRMCASAPT